MTLKPRAAGPILEMAGSSSGLGFVILRISQRDRRGLGNEENGFIAVMSPA